MRAAEGTGPGETASASGPRQRETLSAGGRHNCTVKPDGTLACWGKNTDGQATPAMGTFTQVGAGGSHSCGLKADGTVVCWGYNNFGQVNPLPVGTYIQVSAGGSHACGLKADGMVVCWGDNQYGQLHPERFFLPAVIR